MNDYVLTTNKLTKIYKTQKVVNQVDMHVKKGAIYGLIGRNGAGKTTLMKMFTGLANPSDGELTLFGKTQGDLTVSRTRIGALIEQPGVYGDMTAFQNLKLMAIAMGVYHKKNLEDILDIVGLADTDKKKVKNFSLGMKQRLGIGLALVGSPDILILDEPINGLDPPGVLEIRTLIRQLNREKNMTIIISSHILEELSKVVTDYGIIDRGELLLEISREDMEKKCERKIEIITDQPEKATVVLESMGLTHYTIADNRTIYVFDGLTEIAAINRELTNREIPVMEIKMKNDCLEDFFLKIVTERRKKIC